LSCPHAIEEIEREAPLERTRERERETWSRLACLEVSRAGAASPAQRCLGRCLLVPPGLSLSRRKRETEEEMRKKRGKEGMVQEKIRKIGNKKEIYYLFLEIMIHKLYYPYYYWLIKIEDDIYIN
jgi:hypothetical protein